MSRVAYFKNSPSTASTSYVDSALALKADASALNDLSDEVGNKAGISYVDGQLALKADASALALKADQASVESALALKADQSSVDTALAGKASQGYVDTALALKADQSAVDTALAGKLDASVHSARVTNENNFFEAFADGIFLESSPGSGEAFDYAAAGLINA